MTKTDVVIVGAGQAGSAAAHDLAAAGLRVVMLDKPQNKPCAGGVTVKSLRRLRFSVNEVVRERPMQLDLSLNHWRPLQWQLEKGMCVLVERHELDALCLKKAREAGADYRLIKQITTIRQNDQQVTLETDIGTFQAPWLIAADGAHSPVRRLLVGGEKASGAYAIEARLARDKASRYPGMQFDFNATPKGYGWLFPKDDHINAGLYVSQSGGKLPGKAELKAYVKRALGSDEVTDVSGYPLGTRMPYVRLTAGCALFAGDAAGACEPLLGEGIYGAILTGQLAAQSIIENQKDADKIYSELCSEWVREIHWLNRIASLFYATTPLAYGGLHHLLRPSLVEGYAAGLTPLQSMRLMRGATVG